MVSVSSIGAKSVLCDRHLLPFPCHVVNLLKQSPMVDSVISSREIDDDYAGDFPCFKAIFGVLGEVQHLGITTFAGTETSLLWYKDMFDNGRQAVQYQALVQFVEVKHKGNWV